MLASICHLTNFLFISTILIAKDLFQITWRYLLVRIILKKILRKGRGSKHTRIEGVQRLQILLNSLNFKKNMF